MNKPSTIPSKIGFYIVLLFSFSVSVFPVFSYWLAGAAVIIWMLQIVIFKRSEMMESRMFYPVIALTIFSVLLALLSYFKSVDNRTICLGLYSGFYFVVSDFITTQEKRKMILWTFLSGVILSLGIAIFSALDAKGNIDLYAIILPKHLPGQVIAVYCLILAFYAESIGVREKIFFGLIFVPVFLGLISVGAVIALVLLVVTLAIGIVLDRSVLAILAVTAIVIFSGAFGLRDKFSTDLNSGRAVAAVYMPVSSAKQAADRLTDTGFYGTNLDAGELPDNEKQPLFISILVRSGPPAFILFIWILFELARRDFVKIRKLALREEKAYHLATLLIIAAVSISALYSSAVDCSSAVLCLWMMMGMAEV